MQFRPGRGWHHGIRHSDKRRGAGLGLAAGGGKGHDVLGHGDEGKDYAMVPPNPGIAGGNRANRSRTLGAIEMIQKTLVKTW